MNEAWPGIPSAPRRRGSPVEEASTQPVVGAADEGRGLTVASGGGPGGRGQGQRGQSKGPGSLPDERRRRRIQKTDRRGKAPCCVAASTSDARVSHGGSADKFAKRRTLRRHRGDPHGVRRRWGIEGSRTTESPFADRQGLCSGQPGRSLEHVRDKRAGPGIEAAARIMSAASKPAACKCSRANQGRSRQNRVTGLARRWPPWVHNRPSPTSSSMHSSDAR